MSSSEKVEKLVGVGVGLCSSLQQTKEHCLEWLTLTAKLFQILAICHFYERCIRKLAP